MYECLLMFNPAFSCQTSIKLHVPVCYCTRVKGRRQRPTSRTSCVNGAFEACTFATQCYRDMHSRQQLNVACMHI